MLHYFKLVCQVLLLYKENVNKTSTKISALEFYFQLKVNLEFH